MAKKKYKNIFKAIEANDIEAVKTLLPEQLNTIDMYNRMPLHFACVYGCTEIVRLLLDSGADIEARDNYGSTPLHYVCYWGHTEIAGLLLDNGANIEAKDKYGSTPLHRACLMERTKTSELLVIRGADPTVKNNDGKTPLDFDATMVKDGAGNEVPHRDVLDKLRDAYLINKHALEAANTTAALSSGWEMEM